MSAFQGLSCILSQAQDQEKFDPEILKVPGFRDRALLIRNCPRQPSNYFLHFPFLFHCVNTFFIAQWAYLSINAILAFKSPHKSQTGEEEEDPGEECGPPEMGKDPGLFSNKIQKSSFQKTTHHGSRGGDPSPITGEKKRSSWHMKRGCLGSR